MMLTTAVIVFFSVVVFLILALTTTWMNNILLLIIYPFFYVFSKDRKNMKIPAIRINGGFLIEKFLSAPGDLEKHEYNFNGEKDVYYSKNNGDVLLEYKAVNFITFLNKKYWVSGISTPDKLYMIINPFSQKKVDDFFRSDPPYGGNDRLVEYRDRYIDKLLK